MIADEKPLRVAILTHYIAPYTPASGVGHLQRTLAEGLAQAGHAVTVIGIDVHPERGSLQTWGEIISLNSRETAKKWIPRSVSSAYAVAREVARRRADFDVIESTSWPGLGAFLDRRDLPSVVRLITSISADADVPKLQAAGQFFMEWLAVRRATLVVASTKYIEDKAQETYHFKFKQVARVLLGVADIPLQPQLIDDLSRFCFVVIAAANTRKGTDVLFRALSLAGTVTADFEVVIIGPKYALYEDFARMSAERGGWWRETQDVLGERLTVLSGISDELKLEYLKTSQYLLMTSRSESFGLPVIEAMRSGIPVISSGGGALPEVVGASSSNIIYDDPEDFESLANVMIEAVQRGKADAAARREVARRAYEDHYTVARFIEGTVTAYRRAIKLKNEGKR